VSAGTLLVFGVVALALIWKRIVRPKHSFADNAKPFALMAVLTGCCIGEWGSYHGAVTAAG
jgi:tetrahydromethanopterin S-methyltransferase subunit E